MMIDKMTLDGSFQKFRSSLENVFNLLVPGGGKEEKEVLKQAVAEIYAGTRFCLEKGLDVGVAQDHDFRLSGPGHCILAKASKTHNYFRAIELLGIGHDEAMAMGFACSSQMKSLLSETRLNWNVLYVALWRESADFLLRTP